ncbi:uncharacterized protein BKA78DRAFT_356312 [Phyllosticta capitalensis]|uniref:uncharacterized protein n=1 Tax=Phyllosticta capitalensis TaxID=121624 RepID=UPI00312EE3A9
MDAHAWSQLPMNVRQRAGFLCDIPDQYTFQQLLDHLERIGMDRSIIEEWLKRIDESIPALFPPDAPTMLLWEERRRCESFVDGFPAFRVADVKDVYQTAVACCLQILFVADPDAVYNAINFQDDNDDDEGSDGNKKNLTIDNYNPVMKSLRNYGRMLQNQGLIRTVCSTIGYALGETEERVLEADQAKEHLTKTLGEKDQQLSDGGGVQAAEQAKFAAERRLADKLSTMDKLKNEACIKSRGTRSYDCSVYLDVKDLFATINVLQKAIKEQDESLEVLSASSAESDVLVPAHEAMITLCEEARQQAQAAAEQGNQ